MIVLDASAAVEWLLQTGVGLRIERRVYSRNESLHSPHLLDIEVTHVLRRFARDGKVSAGRCEDALRDLVVLRIARYPHDAFLHWIWQYRHNLSAYDAAYVTLAEELDATLVTCDKRLSLASGHTAGIEAF